MIPYITFCVWNIIHGYIKIREREMGREREERRKELQ